MVTKEQPVFRSSNVSSSWLVTPLIVLSKLLKNHKQDLQAVAKVDRFKRQSVPDDETYDVDDVRSVPDFDDCSDDSEESDQVDHHFIFIFFVKAVVVDDNFGNGNGGVGA